LQSVPNQSANKELIRKTMYGTGHRPAPACEDFENSEMKE